MRKLLIFMIFAGAFLSGTLHAKTMKKFDNDTKSCAMLEQVLFVIKPDAVADNNIGEILEKVEVKDVRVIGLKMSMLTSEEIIILYKDHVKKPYFNSLSKYMMSGPVVLAVLEGKDVILKTRAIAGATDPSKASPDTLRSKYGTDVQRNAVHVSDSIKSAKREIPLFFQLNELFSPCAQEVFKPEKTPSDPVGVLK